MSTSLQISSEVRQRGSVDAAWLEQALRLFAQQGYLVIEDLFPQDLMDSLYQAYLQGLGQLSEQDLFKTSLCVGNRRFMTPLPLSGAFGDPQLYAHPIIMSLMNVLLDGKFLLSSSTVVSSLPHSDFQPYHRDNGFPYGFMEISRMMPPFAVSMAMPLIDLTPETGTTELLTGSHMALRPVESFYGETGFCPMLKRGSVYFIDYRLVHRGRPNQSEMRRPIMYYLYTKPWYVDSTNHDEWKIPSLLAERSLFKHFPEPIQKLLLRAELFNLQVES